MSNYLDVSKSVMISSPAGSGKTEKLARRYIALLRSGVDVERILAITFTDKAAAEMKQRILRILRQEDKDIFEKLREKMPLMRVYTIHSFCGTLLRRFSFEASLDPNYRVEDAVDSRILWEKILYEILLEAGDGKAGHDILFQVLSEKGFKGLEYLKTTVNYLFEKNPFSLEAEIPNPLLHSFINGRMEELVRELREWPGAGSAIENYEELFEADSFPMFASVEKFFLTESKMPRRKTPAAAKGIVDYPGWASKMFLFWKEINEREFEKRAERLKLIFSRCFEKYSDRKALKGILDFSDLEYICFRLLNENPEWSNILYSFDEKTDHILVDEFQDTNNFQWGIIDKLTEEWRSGIGAKREDGTVPTVFLVGDEKQSIYLFRGANVEIFHRAKTKLAEWLKDEFCYEEVTENFRSLPAIIDFTNALFSKVMRTADDGREKNKDIPLWVTGYRAFNACRSDMHNTGRVEIILLDDDEAGAAETRNKEADIIAKRINSLVDDFRVTERSDGHEAGSRPCRYMDIALLLRKRTHLKKYEEAFRRYNIPFVAVKGIGFYQEPEVAVLRALIYFLSNPYDDYSLYILLKSPFFSIDEGSIIEAVNGEGDCLFSKWRNMRGSLDSSVSLLEEWLSKIQLSPISELIEDALSATRLWEFFHEAQRRANVKKFIKVVEGLEAEGKSLLKIRDFLERTEERADEPKANVNTEGMDAVRIMTIHGAKGLEFPVVFVPGIDDAFYTGRGDSLIYDREGKLFFKYAPQSTVHRLDEDFALHSMKEIEEQKRLFYVAVTRAEQALFLAGKWNDSDKGFLGFLKQGLGLHKTEKGRTRGVEATRSLLESSGDPLREGPVGFARGPLLRPPRQDESRPGPEASEREIRNGREKIKARHPHRFGSNLDAGASRSQWAISEKLDGLSMRSAHEIDAMYKKAPERRSARQNDRDTPAVFVPLEIKETLKWKAVTSTVDIKRQHGKEWAIIGDIFHRLFEDISKGIITEKAILEKAQKMLLAKDIVKGRKDELLFIIEDDIRLLKEKGIWQEVIMPRDNSFSELPFVLESGKDVYSGRIDRVINVNGCYKIYDYKTFPVDEKEIGYLLKGYSGQLGIYSEAVKKLFKTENVISYIVFTHIGEIREAGVKDRNT